MTTRQEREVVLQGKNAMAESVMAHLAAHGWTRERILRNVAHKTYLPHAATVRVELDSENQQYWVKGEYVSKGDNVLATCFACIPSTAAQADVFDAMDAFIQEAEQQINQSFAVRFLGPQAQQ